MKKYIAPTLLLTLLATNAIAMPGMDKFAKMDSNKDNAVSAEEFKAAYPQMTDAVFPHIDTDKNASISKEEWQVFQVEHGKSMRQEEGKAMGSQAPAHDEKKPAPIRISPPKKEQ